MPPLQYIQPIFYTIIVLNAAAAFVTVFRDRNRDIAATWAWLLVLIWLPIIGFIAYAFVGRKLPKNRLFRLRKEMQIRLEQMIQRQREALGTELMPADAVTSSVRGMVSLFLNSDGALLSRKNRVKIYTDGHEKFHAMFQDIEAAKNHIHIEYYTFYNDQIGNELLHLLERKAAQGVDVRVLYDPWGSMGTFRSFFKHLEELGGHARPFLGAHSAILDFRLNFRDHRKIVVTDGRVGYVGGFNVGDQYLGRSKKLVTGVIPICGSSVQEFLNCRNVSFVIGTPPMRNIESCQTLICSQSFALKGILHYRSSPVARTVMHNRLNWVILK